MFKTDPIFFYIHDKYKCTYIITGLQFLDY